jgi:hypothetical protein
LAETLIGIIMEVVQCGIHGFAETIGIDVDEFRVYWKLHASKETTTQVAYRLLVSTNRDLDSEDGMCFDSGRCEGNNQRNVLCNPREGFQSTTLYYWMVKVWSDDGSETTSAVHEFYTSYPRSSRMLPPYSMNQTYVSTKRANLSIRANADWPSLCRCRIAV